MVTHLTISETPFDLGQESTYTSILVGGPYEQNDCENDVECTNYEQCIIPKYSEHIKLVQKKCLQVCSFNSDCLSNVCHAVKSPPPWDNTFY
jgi:hypothetical protein